MLREEKIAEFQKLVMKHCGKKISREEAIEKGDKLIRLLQLTYLPMTEEDFQLVQKRRQEMETLNQKS